MRSIRGRGLICREEGGVGMGMGMGMGRSRDGDGDGEGFAFGIREGKGRGKGRENEGVCSCYKEGEEKGQQWREEMHRASCCSPTPTRNLEDEEETS